MKTFYIWIDRYLYTCLTTIGKMTFSYDGKEELFGYTLEDTVRPANIKVQDYTAIPEGWYNVAIRNSPKFGETVIFYTEPDQETIIKGPLTWKFCLAHGGNTHEDTSGCVLVAMNKISNTIIQGSLQKKLTKIVKKKITEGYTIKARFENLTQIS
jgi:hypothetical protein